MLKRVLIGLLVLSGSFVGGFAGLRYVGKNDLSLFMQARPAPTPASASNNTPMTDIVALNERFGQIAKKVLPTVVYVEARKESNRPGGGRDEEESGSGVFVRFEGRAGTFVLTNQHVVNHSRPERIIVHAADGRIFRPTKLWGDEEADVAILQIDTMDVPVASLGNSDQLQIGNFVLAMGSPFGLNQTVTHGILSARERGQISLGSTIRIKDFLQTDAAINPGSSGGPLVNLNAEVVGINTAIASPNGSNTGVSFSIPINLYKRIALQLLEKGRVSRGYLGVQLSNTYEPSEALRLGLDRANGALVEAIYPNTPGQRAGLRVGDVILDADGNMVRNENHLINLISSLDPGTPLKLGVWRERKKIAITVTVGDWEGGRRELKAAQGF
jgi:S1-C subfamily serine protease